MDQFPNINEVIRVYPGFRPGLTLLNPSQLRHGDNPHWVPVVIPWTDHDGNECLTLYFAFGRDTHDRMIAGGWTPGYAALSGWVASSLDFCRRNL